LLMRGTGTAGIVIAPRGDCQRRADVAGEGRTRSARGDAAEWKHAAFRLRARRDGRYRLRLLRFHLGVDREAVRTLPAVRTAKEDRAVLAPHAVVMTAREVAVEPIPHDESSSACRFGWTPYGKCGAVVERILEACAALPFFLRGSAEFSVQGGAAAPTELCRKGPPRLASTHLFVRR